MAENTLEQKPNNNIKHDWYQTETTVVITVLVKNIQQNNLKVNFNPKNVEIDLILPEAEGTKHTLNYNLLHEIVPEQSTYKLSSSKIEVKLKKSEGIRWDKLEVDPKAAGTTDKPPVYPTSKGTDWTAIEKDIRKAEENEKPEGEEALNKLFQEIYGKGSDEVKKAMNKSYLESGGTVLSTNWNEIGKDKVKVQPPDGMEWKKWE